MNYGYAGKILDIDLTTGQVNERPLPEELCRNYLGGTGFNAFFLYREIPPSADPLAPENVLVFSSGALTGTAAPTASRSEASALSPVTGLLGTSSSGGYWGAELKYAGFDGLIIRGKAGEPVYLMIEDGNVTILPATKLWGLDAWETINSIRVIHGDGQIQIACIGPAGENRVRFASIENGPFDAWGRTGLGAVMGSKKLKAIAVRGRGAIKVFARKRFWDGIAETRRTISGSPFFHPFKKYGTMLASLPYQQFAALPGRNFQQGKIEGWEETCSRKQLPRYSKRGMACISCPLACAHWVEIEEGPYAGLRLKDLEVTPVIAFGAGCAANNLAAVAKITETCQRYGLDMVSTGAAVAFAMELYQRGMITEKDAGFELSWGDESAILKLIRIIACREGLGDVLAEGTKRASTMIKGSENYSLHVKGLECFFIDPRARWSTWTLGYITNTRGGDHLRTRNPVEDLRHNENPLPYRTEKFSLAEEMLAQLDMDENLKGEIFDPVTKDVNIPKMSKWSEDLIALYNAVGLCIRPPVLHTVGPTMIAKLYSCLTGLELSPEEMIKCGERIWNLQKLFNLKHGERPQDADFPARFYQEPSSTGRTLDKEKVKQTLQEYYTARGWDPETGRPRRSKLAELGLIF